MKLIKEAQHQFIVPMNKPLIDEISKEIINSDKELEEILELKNRDKSLVQSDAETCNKYLLENAKLGRNKRCVLAYLNNRIDKIQNLIWQLGLPFPEHLANSLDEKEKKYAEEYSALLKKYSKSNSFSLLDVTTDTLPPTDLFVEIRALEDINKVKTKGGEVKLEKNMTYYLRRSDIDYLLKKGLVEINE